jgi:hypothetical protein
MASAKGTSEMAAAAVEGTVERTSPIRRMLGAMAMDATMETERVFTGDDIMGILNAETEEEMFEADQEGPLNFQQLGGCEIAIVNVDVKFGKGGNDDDAIKTMFVDPDTGRQMYLMVTAYRISDAGGTRVRKLPEIGEQFQANTSARFVVAKLWWLSQHGKIDESTNTVAEVMVQSTDLGSGQAVIKLLPVPKRATRA